MVDHIQYHLPDWMAGTEELSFEQEAVYRKLCDFIYLLNGHLKDDDIHNARRLKLSTRKYRRLKNYLVEIGKIDAVNGWLKNGRATKELEKVAKLSHKMREKAAKRWQNKPPKTLKNNKTDHAADHAQGYANSETSKEEKNPPPIVPPNLAFEQFWKAFPKGRKNAKKKTSDKFIALVKSGTVTADQLTFAATAYHAKVGDDFEFVLMPLTWLNQERWNDDDPSGPEPTKPIGGGHGANGIDDRDRRRRLAAAYDRRMGEGPADAERDHGTGDTGSDGRPVGKGRDRP